VIDWSWNLLAEPERRALRWLSLFHDGFTLETAEEILGADVIDAVQNLVDQSLLSVRETTGGVRYRMLETVREFGRLRLSEAGELAAAEQDRRNWAVRYSARHGADLFSERQFAAIDAVAAEETNLGDELRRALAAGDVDTVVRLVAVLAEFWQVRGEHSRVLVLLGAVAEVVRGWEPPPDVVGTAMAAGVALLTSALALENTDVAPILDLLTRLGPEAACDPLLAGRLRVLLAVNADSAPAVVQARLCAFAGGADRNTALTALVLLTHLRENSGDTRSAAAAADRALALTRPQDGPWLAAMLHTQLAELTMRLGENAVAHAHAQAALPVLARLGAYDDHAQLRALLAFQAIGEQRFDDAEELLASVAKDEQRLAGAEFAGTLLGSALMVGIARAELSVGRGRTVEGLRQYVAAIEQAKELRLPGVPASGLEPWVLFSEAVAVAAFARHATTDEQVAVGRDVYLVCLARCARLLRQQAVRLDYPVFGSALFALGTWALRDGPGAAADSPTVARPDDAVRLLVFAERFGYNATVATLSWAPWAAAADRRCPGGLATINAELGHRRGAALLDEARSLVQQLADTAAVPVAPRQVPPVGSD
jgi:hypothetical protein